MVEGVGVAALRDEERSMDCYWAEALREGGGGGKKRRAEGQ